MDVFRAFRILGRFAWPPLPDPNLARETPRDGLIEIFYVSDENDEHRACLRWTPKASDKFRTAWDRKRIFQHSTRCVKLWSVNDDVLKCAVGKLDADASIVFDVSPRTDDVLDEGVRIAFSGATVLDQFDPTSPEEFRRFALVRSAKFSAETKTSSILFGQPKNKSFRFDLNFPVPVQPNVQNHAINIARFSTIYGSKVGKDARGTFEDLSVYGQTATKNVKLDNIQLNNRRLGKCGFAQAWANGKVFKGQYLKIPVGQNGISDQFWADDEKLKASDLFACVGISTEVNPWQLSSDPTYRSFDFPAQPKSDYEVRSRVSFAFGSDDEKLGPDLKKVGGHLRAKLSRAPDFYFPKSDQLFNATFDIRCRIALNDEDILQDVTHPGQTNISVSLVWDEVFDRELGLNNLSDSAKDSWFRRAINSAIKNMRLSRADIQNIDTPNSVSFLPELGVETEGSALVALMTPPKDATRSDQGKLVWDSAVVNAPRLTLFPAEYLIKSETRTGLKLRCYLPGFQANPSVEYKANVTYNHHHLTFDHDPSSVSSDVGRGEGGDFFLRLKLVELGYNSAPTILGQLGNLLFTRNAPKGKSTEKNQPEAKTLLVSGDNETYSYLRLKLVELGYNSAATILGQLGNLLFTRNVPKGKSTEKKQPEAKTLLVSGDSETYSYLRIGSRVDKLDTKLNNEGQAVSEKAYANQVAIDLNLRLAIDDIEPIIAGGDDNAPLLIPMGEGSAPSSLTVSAKQQPANDGEISARYILDVREILSDDRGRSLRARLYDKDESESRKSYILIGGAPWSVIGFSMPSLGSLGNEASGLVAEYDSTSHRWTIGESDPIYRYELPPMVVGESADKPGRLEVLDRASTDNSPSPLKLPDDLKRFPIESRLPPSTTLWIDPQDRQRKSLARWDVRDLFNQEQIGGLGVAFRGLQAEFLYGITAFVDPQRSEVPTRVNEIEAVVGRPLGEPLLSNPDAELTRRWRALAASYASRPQRLEITTANAADNRVFPLARFSRGVSFELRETALHRPATSDNLRDIFDSSEIEGEATESEATEGEATEGEATEGEVTKGLRFHRRGLSGGALWPVEQRNLLRALQLNFSSSGGSLEYVALTPLGGDADQDARFLGGQVGIISRTRGGFVERYRIEVIGRIACYWHRAKHVVVYERTVNPSAQFAPEMDTQRSRRPILRKVSEFIEIIETERAYPDTADAPAKATGPIEAVRFNSRIINVDSFWSEDLGNWGWRIPLWNRHASVVKPDVYPRPDIAFVTRAEGPGDSPKTSQECRNPEHMTFVADFATGGDETDTWPIRIGVDTRDGAVPGEIDAKTIDKSEEPPEDAGANPRRGSVTRIPLGARRFTALLAPSGQRTQINAYRSDKPVFVDLESVTFMRSPPVSHSTGKTGAAEGLSKVGISNVTDKLWLSGQPSPVLYDDIREAIHSLQSLANSNSSNQGEFENRRQILLEKISNIGFEEKIKGAIPNVSASFEEATAYLQAPKSFCSNLRSNAEATVRRKYLLAVDRFNAEKSLIKDKIKNGPTEYDKTQLTEALTSNVLNTLKPAFDRSSQDVGTVKRDFATARAIVSDILSDWRATIGSTRERIDELNRQYDLSKPESEARINAFADKLKGQVAGVAADLQAAVDEGVQRLSTEIGSVGDALAVPLTAQLKYVVQGAELFKVEVKEAVALAAAQLGEWQGRIDKSKATASEIQAKVQQIKPPLDDVQTAIGNVQTHLKSASDATEIIKQNLIADNVGLSFEKIDSAVIAPLSHGVDELSEKVISTLDSINQLAAKDAVFISRQLKSALQVTHARIDAMRKRIVKNLNSVFAATEGMVRATHIQLDTLLDQLETAAVDVGELIDSLADGLNEKIKKLEEFLNGDDGISSAIKAEVVEPAVSAVLAPLPETIQVNDDIDAIYSAIDSLDRELASALSNFSGSALSLSDEVEDLCVGLGDNLNGLLGKLANSKWGTELNEAVDALVEDIGRLELGTLADNIGSIEESIRNLANEITTAGSLAETYKNKVIEQLGDIGEGGVTAVPGNLLALYSTVSSSPELGSLKANIDRIRSNLKVLEDAISTTEAQAALDLIGDRLKALGISIPFDKIIDSIIPKDVGADGLTKYLKNLCGFDVSKLLPDTKIPSSLSDAVKITHDFDKKTKRAWVHVDVKFDLPGRETLFTLGPFKLDFVDTKLTAMLHLEVSAESKEIEENGSGRIETNVEAVVAGQKMVGLEKLAITYSDKKGLDFELDPKNIKLNNVLKFVQDTLDGLFPDDLGGLEWVKDNGVPVGVEYAFKSPVINANAATSGIQNIQIGNKIRLLAYPDFKLTNGFSFCTPEKPFIFSFFILGGTGYVLVDADYRPFDDQLSVLVSAGAGGSASLAFAFGPVTGSIYITLTVTLSFRKLIGRSDSSDLTIGLTLLVSGNVDVAGVVRVCLILALDLMYRSNGGIDAHGKLILKIRITRFFRIKVRTDVQYRLRGGKSETITKTTTNVSTFEKLEEKLDKLKNAVEKVQ